MVAGLKNLSYVQRLERLNLTTLEKRRKRGDLIEMYKLLTEKENVDYRQFFRKEDSQHRLRGHSYKVFRCSFPASEQLSGNRSSVTGCARGRTICPRPCTPHAAAQLQPIHRTRLTPAAPTAPRIMNIHY